MGLFGSDHSTQIVTNAVRNVMQASSSVSQGCAVIGSASNTIEIGGGRDIGSIDQDASAKVSLHCLQSSSTHNSMKSEMSQKMAQQAKQVSNSLSLRLGGSSSTQISNSFQELSQVMASAVSQSCSSHTVLANVIRVTGHGRVDSIRQHATLDAVLDCAQKAVFNSAQFGRAVQAIDQVSDQEERSLLGSLGFDSNMLVMLGLGALGIFALTQLGGGTSGAGKGGTGKAIMVGGVLVAAFIGYELTK